MMKMRCEIRKGKEDFWVNFDGFELCGDFEVI